MKLFGIEINKPDNVTEEEIIAMVNDYHEHGLLNVDEKIMIKNIFEFSDKEASNIMTARNNILALPIQTTIEDALNFFMDNNKSRIPVFEENIDHIKGILHFRDLVKAYMSCEDKSILIGSIENLIMEPTFVPEVKKVDSLFRQMQKNRLQMVIVIDEYGQTEGIVAMEDILEEIVGSIQDEHDDDEKMVIKSENDNEFVVDGMIKLDEVEDMLGISFGEQEVETLNGFLISKLEHIPEEGEDFETDVEGYSFKILNVENKCIKNVLVRRR